MDTPSPESQASNSEIPVAAAVPEGPGVVRPPSPQPIVIQHGGGGFFLRLLAICGWAGFAFCGLLAIGQMVALGEYFDTTSGITEKFHSGSKFARQKVAILDISGVIMDGHGFVKSQIDRIRGDKDIKAVVVRVNSPGGTISGSDYIYHHLNKLRTERDLPLIVSMGSVAASGGYYVAMAVGDQEQTIYAEPTTTTGSIGVIIPHYDLSGLMARFDVKDDSIASHPRKQMLSMTRPIAEDHREILQGYVNEAFGRFKDIVKSGRPNLREDEGRLATLATGEIFTATQAQENGLVDEIGFIEDAVERAMELAGIQTEKTRVVSFQRPVGLLDLTGLPVGKRPPPSEFSMILELGVPRAYYLATSLPPLIASYSQITRN